MGATTAFVWTIAVVGGPAAGAAFTIVLLIGGVATALYTFSFVVAQLVEGGLQNRWLERRHIRMLDELNHHFIVGGVGRMGHIIASEFARERISFVLVERDPSRLQEAAMWSGDDLVVLGRPENLHELEVADGAHSAAAVPPTTP